MGKTPYGTRICRLGYTIENVWKRLTSTSSWAQNPNSVPLAAYKGARSIVNRIGASVPTCTSSALAWLLVLTCPPMCVYHSLTSHSRPVVVMVAGPHTGSRPTFSVKKPLVCNPRTTLCSLRRMKDRLDSEKSQSRRLGCFVSSRIISCSNPRPWSTLPAKVPRTSTSFGAGETFLDEIFCIVLPKSVLY
jgi:hypothetical protein